LLGAAGLGASGGVAIEQAHVAPGPRVKYTKVLALGITDDRETRHRFEDKLVSHLRARGVGALTSYSFAENLIAPGDREEILGAIAGAGVDAVLTVRVVPLDKKGAAAWPAAWMAAVESPETIRELVARTLPVPDKPGKRLGVEITLWDLERRTRPWSARTSVASRDEIRQSAGSLMQATIDRLAILDLF
jgi:hypothetical protein